ncbi:MAG: hypothetical protein ACI854_000619 [Arenicella sp.]|jgi:hypothetical protein
MILSILDKTLSIETSLNPRFILDGVGLSVLRFILSRFTDADDKRFFLYTNTRIA